MPGKKLIFLNGSFVFISNSTYLFSVVSSTLGIISKIHCHHRISNRNEQMSELKHTHIMELKFNFKSDRNSATCSYLDKSVDIMSEKNQAPKKIHCLCISGQIHRNRKYMVTITYCGKAIMQSCFVRIISVLQI
jgi:hypothetical protein